LIIKLISFNYSVSICVVELGDLVFQEAGLFTDPVATGNDPEVSLE